MKCELVLEKLIGHAAEGKVGKFHVKCGDSVEVGDLICTVEAGKGSIKCKSKFSGEVINILCSEGDTVKKGDLICLIEGEESAPAKSAPTPKAKKSTYSFDIGLPKKEMLQPDLLVVGGGPGGYVAAIRGAQLGQAVVLIEEDALGGTCLNYGCIPTKSLVHSVEVLESARTARKFGVDIQAVKPNLKNMMQRKNEVVSTLVSGIKNLMDSNDIKVIKGKAVAKAPNVFTVNNKQVNAEIKAKKIILATGSLAAKLPIDGHTLPNVITSKELLEMQTIPQSLTIIGGGVIGMEFAFIFAALGTQVQVIEYQDQILATLDQDVIDVVLEQAAARNIKIYTGMGAQKIMQTVDKKLIVQFGKDDQSKFVTSEYVLMATGRKANIKSVDLDKLGVELNERGTGIKVNESMQTSNEQIYAIGDVTNIIQLAHVASHQGIVAAEHACGLASKMDYSAVPSAIFTNPEIATVGLTEASAKRQGVNVKVSKFFFNANGKAQAMGSDLGFVKLLADVEKDVIIGGTIIGAHSTDMLPALVHLIKERVPVEQAAHTIYAHPTAAESIHEALLGLKDRALHIG